MIIILTLRLNHLCEHGLLTRSVDPKDGRRTHYRLTEKGEDLAPALVAIMQWGDHWISGTGREPIILRDRETDALIAPVRLHTHDGRLVTGERVQFTLGPGADANMRARRRARQRDRTDATPQVPARPRTDGRSMSR